MSTHLPLSPACGFGARYPSSFCSPVGDRRYPLTETGPWLLFGVLGLVVLSLHSPYPRFWVPLWGGQSPWFQLTGWQSGAKSESSPVAWKRTGVEPGLAVHTSRTGVALSGITRVTELGGSVGGGDTGGQRGQGAVHLVQID